MRHRYMSSTTSRTPAVCHGRHLLRVCCAIAFAMLAGCSSVVASAQMMGGAPGEGRLDFPNLPSVRGTVTSVQGSDIAIKTDDGVPYTVHCSDNTRVYKNRQPMKVADIRAGDMLIAAGDLDDKAHLLRAIFVGDVDAATVQKMRADLGKTWIAGKITAIDMDTLKLTVQRMDQKTQVILVDDTTSFKKDGQSVTLQDLKLGDTVRGQGDIKDGIFVPTVLNIVDPSRTRRRSGSSSAPPPASPQHQR